MMDSRSESITAYERERWQVEHTTELQRHRLLSCVVAEHALCMIDGICAGTFKASAIRQLVNIEQRWKELAQLSSNGSCVEKLSNVFVQHLEDPIGTALPWQPSDFLAISGSCVKEHHQSFILEGRGGVAHQRLTPLSERHFECYARVLSRLAQLDPGTETWYGYAAHAINAAVALGTHLDWVVAVRKNK